MISPLADAIEKAVISWFNEHAPEGDKRTNEARAAIHYLMNLITTAAIGYVVSHLVVIHHFEHPEVEAKLYERPMKEAAFHFHDVFADQYEAFCRALGTGEPPRPRLSEDEPHGTA